MVDDSPIAVIRLCDAVEEATAVLGASGTVQADLRAHTTAARRALRDGNPDVAAAMVEVRAIRYLLVESCDGPAAAILADSAARIIGDGIGKIFS